MSDHTRIYCRLCAVLQPTAQTIALDKDLVANSKIISKLTWINIDIPSSNGLPNTICYICLDLLERTWSFLNNVRTAQEKLNALFLTTTRNNKCEIGVENTDLNTEIPGKPVDGEREKFQDLKLEIKIENLNENVSEDTNDMNCSSDGNQLSIKLETDRCRNNSDDSNRRSSTDSDVPLKMMSQAKYQSKKSTDVPHNITVRKKLGRPKGKSKFDIKSVSWANQACVCAKCDAYFKNITLLQNHSLQTHKSCCIFKCTDCSKILTGHRSYIRHTRTHNSYLKKYCEYCNKLFMSLPDLRMHRINNHNNVHKIVCCNCGLRFETEQEMEEHRKLYSKNAKLKTAEEDTEYACEECGRVCKTKANLYQHKKTHKERTKEFACHICCKMFYTKGVLSTHLTHMHLQKDKPYKCDLCSLAFRAKGNLVSHMKLHLDIRPFVCEQCGKRFRIKRHLESHAIVHTDSRPFACEKCKKTFRFKSTLQIHSRQPSCLPKNYNPNSKRKARNRSKRKKDRVAITIQGENFGANGCSVELGVVPPLH